MSRKDKKETNLVRSVNKNIRSSTRKLNPILKGIVGKKSWFSDQRSWFFKQKNMQRY